MAEGKRRKSQHATKITSIKERAERMQRRAREALLGWLALSAIRSSLIPLPYDTLQYYYTRVCAGGLLTF